MPHNQLLQIRKQKNNSQNIIFYITPKAKYCKNEKMQKMQKFYSFHIAFRTLVRWPRTHHVT